jgi:alkylation response protein AidB-like acyl-CoA dehydrogenase
MVYLGGELADGIGAGRPEGSSGGGKGLALFYVETRDAADRLNGIRVERLKDKLGTRKVPTAELYLDGCRAQLVGEAHDGTRAIEPMLMITRVWNAVSAAAFMRRGLALAHSYAMQRKAFGKQLAALPLHVETLAMLEVETRRVPADLRSRAFAGFEGGR